MFVGQTTLIAEVLYGIKQTRNNLANFQQLHAMQSNLEEQLLL
jgi:hypothetical protein